MLEQAHHQRAVIARTIVGPVTTIAEEFGVACFYRYSLDDELQMGGTSRFLVTR